MGGGSSGRSPCPPATDTPGAPPPNPKNEEGPTSALIGPSCLSGGAEGNRTPDPQNAILVLSQLSYNPKATAIYRINGDRARPQCGFSTSLLWSQILACLGWGRLPAGHLPRFESAAPAPRYAPPCGPGRGARYPWSPEGCGLPFLIFGRGGPDRCGAAEGGAGHDRGGPPSPALRGHGQGGAP